MVHKSLDHESLNELADHVPAMHCRISADFLHDWANPSWFEFTGGCLEEERGFAWVEKVHPQDRETLIAGLDRAFAAREPFSAEFRIRGRDGAIDGS